jgi:hypothetical protein
MRRHPRPRQPPDLPRRRPRISRGRTTGRSDAVVLTWTVHAVIRRRQAWVAPRTLDTPSRWPVAEEGSCANASPHVKLHRIHTPCSGCLASDRRLPSRGSGVKRSSLRPVRGRRHRVQRVQRRGVTGSRPSLRPQRVAGHRPVGLVLRLFREPPFIEAGPPPTPCVSGRSHGSYGRRPSLRRRCSRPRKAPRRLDRSRLLRGCPSSRHVGQALRDDQVGFADRGCFGSRPSLRHQRPGGLRRARPTRRGSSGEPPFIEADDDAKLSSRQGVAAPSASALYRGSAGGRGRRATRSRGSSNSRPSSRLRRAMAVGYGRPGRSRFLREPPFIEAR